MAPGRSVCSGPRKSTRGGTILVLQSQIWFAEPTWEQFDTDAEIVGAVAADPSALGFASVGHDQGVRYLGLRMNRYGNRLFRPWRRLNRSATGWPR